MKKCPPIIGIYGKTGSGKSYISDQLSKLTNVKVVHLDKNFIEIAKHPVIKFFVKRKLNTDKWVVKNNNVSGLSSSIEKEINQFERTMLGFILNNKLKSIIKEAKEPLIVDYYNLPSLKAINKCNITVKITCDSNVRIKKLAERENCEEIDIIKSEHKNRKLLQVDAYDPTYIIHNDYQDTLQKLPVVLDKITTLVADYNDVQLKAKSKKSNKKMAP